jgi:hypothetical protein
VRERERERKREREMDREIEGKRESQGERGVYRGKRPDLSEIGLYIFYL